MVQRRLGTVDFGQRSSFDQHVRPPYEGLAEAVHQGTRPHFARERATVASPFHCVSRPAIARWQAGGRAPTANRLPAGWADDRRDALARHRVDHAALADDGPDQPCRRDVEGGIVDLHSRRRRLPAEAVRDFVLAALLDRNLAAVGERKSKVLVGAAT